MSAAMALQSLERFAEDVEADIDADPNFTDSREALVFVLAAIRDCRADLAGLYKKVERDLLAVSGEKRFVVEPLGEVEIKKSTKRSAWDYERLIPTVIALIMDEPATIFDAEDGDLLPYAQIGLNVARRLNECVGSSYGKTTGIRALGLQVDEFCTETPDGYNVKLPKREV